MAAGDRVDPGAPGSDVPELLGALDGPSPQQAPRTLAQSLQRVVDKVRVIPSAIGIRSHRVFLVHAVWSGARRGEGSLQVTSRREILPVPRVRGMDSVRRNARSTGVTEEGDIVVDLVSLRIPEDDLMGRTPDLQDAAARRTARPSVEFWYEVVENRPSDPPPVPRRFVLVGVPELRGDQFGWSLALSRQDVDRGRMGGTGRSDFA